jgi:hypothetical protein
LTTVKKRELCSLKGGLNADKYGSGSKRVVSMEMSTGHIVEQEHREGGVERVTGVCKRSERKTVRSREEMTSGR